MKPKPPQRLPKLPPNYSQTTSKPPLGGDFWRPDAIRIGARARMASGETFGVKSLNRPAKSAYLIALLPLGPPKIAYLIALCYVEVAKVL